MRYLGNKSKLLDFIDNVIKKYDIQGDTFGDLFAGTGVVGDYFKDRFKIISNDYMYFSKVINKAKLLNDKIPMFKKFVEKYEVSPFEW
ncbi:modification methylase, partial [Listeria monocytogenes]|nr:modification methylase [Listeria monocytogenes]